MSIRVSSNHHIRTIAQQWDVYSSDNDIITGADVLDHRGIVVSLRFKPHSYSPTNHARVILRHSDDASSGYEDVPSQFIEGGSGADGVLRDQTATITPDDEFDVHNYGYTGSKRYLAVRFVEVGSVSSAGVGASIVASAPRQLSGS